MTWLTSRSINYQDTGSRVDGSGQVHMEILLSEIGVKREDGTLYNLEDEEIMQDEQATYQHGTQDGNF